MPFLASVCRSLLCSSRFGVPFPRSVLPVFRSCYSPVRGTGVFLRFLNGFCRILRMSAPCKSPVFYKRLFDCTPVMRLETRNWLQSQPLAAVAKRTPVRRRGKATKMTNQSAFGFRANGTRSNLPALTRLIGATVRGTTLRGNASSSAPRFPIRRRSRMMLLIQ